MDKRSKQPRENNIDERGEKYQKELNRMDYEGGNQGKEGANKLKTEKEDRDTNEPLPEQPGKQNSRRP